MADIKIVLRKKKAKDGSYPLAIRITKDRKSSFIHLGHNIQEKDWDALASRVKKSYPNSSRLNALITARLHEANGQLLEVETLKKEVSSRAVKQKIKPAAGATFFAQAEIYLNDLKETGKYNRYTADKPRVRRFRDFLRGQDIAFSDVTVGLLEKFKIYLKAGSKISERTVINHLVVIRSVFSYAIKQNATDVKYYPFGKGKIAIRFPETTKVGISREDVEKLENVQLENSSHDHARNLWLICFYFAGMRISDVLRLRWADFQDTRLHYTMGKNNKSGSLKVPVKAKQILNKYLAQKESEDGFIFPDLKKLPPDTTTFVIQRTIAFAASRNDKILRLHVAPEAGIKANLTMHIARHTFATLAGDKIPIQMLQKLYRHSNITTTIGYQANFINQDTDDALDAVIGS